MAKIRIRLSGDWPAWNPDVREGRMTDENGDVRRVLVNIRRDLPVDDDGKKRARRDGRRLAALNDPGMLNIHHVSVLDGHIAEVSQFFPCASLSVITSLMEEYEKSFELRTIVEIAAEVAGVLAAVLGGAPDSDALVVHDGVMPAHVLLDDGGTIKITGFGILRPDEVRRPSHPAYLPPEGFEPSGSSYGIGALMVQLLTGELPPVSLSAPSEHRALLEEIVVAIHSRGGTQVPDELTDAIRSCLAHQPDDRPRLGSLANELRDLARRLPGRTLRAWTARIVPAVLNGTGLAVPRRSPLSEPPVRSMGESGANGTNPVRSPETSDSRDRRHEFRPLPVAVMREEDQERYGAVLSLDDEPTVSISKTDGGALVSGDRESVTIADTGLGGPAVDIHRTSGPVGLSLGAPANYGPVGISADEPGRLNETLEVSMPDGQRSRQVILVVALVSILVVGAFAYHRLSDSTPENATAEREIETTGSEISIPQEASGVVTEESPESNGATTVSTVLEEERTEGSEETHSESSNTLGVPEPEERVPEPEERVPEPEEMGGDGEGAVDSPEAVSSPVNPTDEAGITDETLELPDRSDEDGGSSSPLEGPSPEPDDSLDSSEEFDEDELDMNVRISAPPESSSVDVEADSSEPVSAALLEFTVEFHSLDSTITNLVVSCQEGAGTGPVPVRIVNARTPCSVRGRRDDGTNALRINVPLDSSAIYYCYEDGVAECRKEAF